MNAPDRSVVNLYFFMKLVEIKFIEWMVARIAHASYVCCFLFLHNIESPKTLDLHLFLCLSVQELHGQFLFIDKQWLIRRD